MNNQVMIWAGLILPWFTLLFMKREDIKRFMPVALFTMVTSAIIYELGITFKLWDVQENIYPFNQTIPIIYGSFPVLVMWIFKFTSDRFWVYMGVNMVLDIGWVYLLLPWMVRRGMLEFVNALGILYLLSISHAVLLYLYLTWQEGVSVSPGRSRFSLNLPPAAAKLLFKNNYKKIDNH